MWRQEVVLISARTEEDLEKQQEQVEKLMERGVCGLIIQAVEEAKIPALADQCAEKQIPVV